MKVLYAARWLERFALAMAVVAAVLWWTGNFKALDVTLQVFMIGIMIGSVVIVAIGLTDLFRKQVVVGYNIFEERQDG